MALNVDGNCGGGAINHAATITTGAMTTTGAPSETLVAVCYVEGGAAAATVSSITDSQGATSFSLAERFTTGDGFTSNLEVWLSNLSTNLSAATFTFNMNTSGALYDAASVCVLAVSGTSGVEDPNGALPATVAWTGSANHATVSTSNANDMLLACAGIAANHNLNSDTVTTYTRGATGTNENNSHSATAGIAYDIVSSTQSSVSTQPYSGNPNLVVIALEAGSQNPPPPPLFTYAKCNPGVIGL